MNATKMLIIDFEASRLVAKSLRCHYEQGRAVGALYAQHTSQRDRHDNIHPYHSQGKPPRRHAHSCLLYTSPSPRDRTRSRMPSSA